MVLFQDKKKIEILYNLLNNCIILQAYLLG